MAGTVYLVDYENVHERGLYGVRMLSPDDAVYIVFTDNADKISLDCITELTTPLHTLRVPSGQQSLDMHLASVLGYMIGKETDNATRYVVVSKDTDYDGITRYWCYQLEIEDKVSRRCCISEEASWIAPRPADNPNAVDCSVLTVSDHEVVCQAIRKAIEEAGESDPWGCQRIDFSQLCSVLNGMPEYARERQRCGKKPQQMLKEEYADQIWIGQDRKTVYAYLVKQPSTTICDNNAPAICDEDSASSVCVDEVSICLNMPGKDEMIHDNSDEFANSSAQAAESVLADEVKHGVPSPELPYAGIVHALLAGGMEKTQASLLAPVIYEAENKGNTKVYLYNVLRKSFGGAIGARYYREARDILRL